MPVYAERTRIDFGRLKVSVDQPDGMVLYLKGRFMPADTSGLDKQLAFDRKLLKARIVDEEGNGPRYLELQKLMRQLKSQHGQLV